MHWPCMFRGAGSGMYPLFCISRSLLKIMITRNMFGDFIPNTHPTVWPKLLRDFEGQKGCLLPRAATWRKELARFLRAACLAERIRSKSARHGKDVIDKPIQARVKDAHRAKSAPSLAECHPCSSVASIVRATWGASEDGGLLGTPRIIVVMEWFGGILLH